MPKRLAGGGVEGHQIVRRVSGKDQIARRAQHAGTDTGALPLVAPANCAGLIIDGLQHGFGPASAIVASPAFRLLIVVEYVIHAEAARGVDVEQPCVGTETRRRPVRCAGLVRRHQSAVNLRLLRGVRDRLAFGVDALRPIRLDELLGDDILPGYPVQDEEVTIAAGLSDKLPLLAVDFAVD